MKPMRKTALRVVGTVFVVALCFGGYRLFQYFSALQDALQCDVTVKRKIPSPHYRRLAVVFEKDCGATTPFNTQVSIAAGTKPFSSDKFPSFLSLRGQHALTVGWLDEETIQIEIPKGAEVFRQDRRADGVAVLYR
jgi:hypothetical protein